MDSEVINTRRRPRYIRHRFGKPGFVFQPRDYEIIQVVSKHRVISSDDLHRRIFGSKQALLRRLQKLFHHAYLDRPRSQRELKNAPMIYALGQKGAEVITRESGSRPSVDWSEKNRQLGRGHLEHALMVSRFQTALHFASFVLDAATVESWQGDGTIRSSVHVENQRGTERIPVAPDAYFVLGVSEVDLTKRTVRVGKSKTEAGTGRVIPLNDRATKVLEFWAEQFPNREPEHFVFPSERYGAGGNKFEPTVYNIDPTRAINSWKEAWETVKENADVTIRFHDLRHTCVTKMLEGGVPLSVVASILGWSPATTARMAKRYGHIGQVAQRQAVAVLDVKPPKSKREKKRSVKEAKPSKRGRHKNGHSEASSLDATSTKH